MKTTWEFARQMDGSVVEGWRLSSDEWRQLQTTYVRGSLLMPCCGGDAVPKLSPNGLHFFAYYAGECATAPATVWHLEAKAAVASAARSLGLSVKLEHHGGSSRERWCADVWIAISSEPLAVEIQHSYQHLREYLKRQERYRQAGVRCLWLLPLERFLTLQRAASKHLIRINQWKHWPEGNGGLLEEFPAAALLLEEGEPKVRGPRLQSTLPAVIHAWLESRLIYDSGAWIVSDSDRRPGIAQ
jgi:competence protein CoiA